MQRKIRERVFDSEKHLQEIIILSIIEYEENKQNKNKVIKYYTR
jgi:hypothetical protein